MNADKIDCLVSLLNESLLNEVLEERVLMGLCCNLVGCPRPEMTEDEVTARRAIAVRARGHSVRDISSKLRALKKEESKQDEEEAPEFDPLFCSESCQL